MIFTVLVDESVVWDLLCQTKAVALRVRHLQVVKHFLQLPTPAMVSACLRVVLLRSSDSSSGAVAFETISCSS
jgi:hypothetical protein